ncbi:MAG: methyltransferase domain-containing protein, partial [Phycisphaerae bacterium]
MKQLVAGLPEVYQPIFRHPALSRNAARSCLDRLAHIRQACAAFSKCLGRPIRVLDIGCAQGFFSLHLAEAGAEVVGIDILETNVRLCNALRGKIPKSNVMFKAIGIEEFLPEIAPGRFDMFLGLSVFHHLCSSRGFDRTKAIVSTLAERISVGVFELASAGEPLPWAQSLPANELSVLSAFSFRHTLDRIPTHLSAVKRPLVVASSEFWLLGDGCGRIEDSMTESHQFARGTHEQSRRYFRGNGLFIKQFSLEGSRGDINRLELTHEAEFLRSPPAGFVPAPKLHSWNLGPHEGWLVREEISGQLLSEIQARGVGYDALRIIRDVLVQLAAMEAVGLYHNDIRIWNTLILENGGATLIDYGAISSDPVDCIFREHPVLSFFAYIEEIASGSLTQNPLLRFPYTLPSRLDLKHGHWVDRIWKYPVKEWSYGLFLEKLLEAEKAKGPERISALSSSAKVDYLERYVAFHAARLATVSAALDVAASDQTNRGKIIESQEAELADRAQQISRLTEWVQQHEAESADRARQIDRLTKLVQQHEAESADRARQIDRLTKLVQQHEAESADRGRQVEQLTAALKTA